MLSGDEFYDDDVTSGPEPTEARVMALAEYRALSPEARAAVDARWADVPEWRKQDLRDEVEFDL